MLLTGAVSFDSDAEDDDESWAILHTPSAAKDNPLKQIVHCSDGAVVEFTPERPWKTLSGLLPCDTWTTLLDNTDRQELAKLLPALGGLDGISTDEALHETVLKLIRGDNFHFGNPLEKIDQEIAAGRLSRDVSDGNCSSLVFLCRASTHNGLYTCSLFCGIKLSNRMIRLRSSGSKRRLRRFIGR